MEISSSGQVGCLFRRFPCLHWTLSGKNCQPLQAATSDTYPYLAQDISFTAHRAQGPGNDPVVRFRPLLAGYRPFSDGQGRYLTNNRQKMFNHDRCSNNQRIYARLYPWGIHHMAHEDGRSAPWGSIPLRGEGYRHQWQELGWP